MNKNIALYICLLLIGRQLDSAVPQPAAKLSYFEKAKKPIAYFLAGISCGVLGALVWSSSTDIETQVQKPQWRWLLQKVTKKTELSKEEFIALAARATLMARILSIGLFSGAAYFLKKGIENNNFGKKIDKLIG